jgi:acetolactate synthase-1/2/3 large subunit
MTMKTNADYVVERLADYGVETVFLLSGGGIMHLQNSVKNAGMKYVCNYHEQACVVAAEAYARIRGFSACMVTFGPGAMNTIAGIASAWYESIPLLVIAGQVRSDIIANYKGIRQLGPQESNVIEVVRPITKYAKSLRLGDDIAHEIDCAVQLAKSGRPGPVFLELPLDVQSAPFVELGIQRVESPADSTAVQGYTQEIQELLRRLGTSRRPLLILGSGVRLSQSQAQVAELAAALHCPVISSHTAKDVFDNYAENYHGIFGTCGNRHANIILQNADLILCLGVGLTISKTGFNPKRFAPLAHKIVVDIDAGQVNQLAVQPDTGIVADLQTFVPQLVGAIRHAQMPAYDAWNALCSTWKARYEFHDLAAPSLTSLNPYRFMGLLSEQTRVTDVVTTGNGLDSVAYCQSYKVKKHQKTILNGNWGSMGWDLPLSVGAHHASGHRVVCVTGDGSIMLNVQELLHMGAYQLPIKIFILNNNGYGSIRATQDAIFASNYIGVDGASGVCNPDFKLLAAAFGIAYTHISNDVECGQMLQRILATNHTEIIEMQVSKSTWITPKASAFKDQAGVMHSRELDDMYPFLEREEVAANKALASAI